METNIENSVKIIRISLCGQHFISISLTGVLGFVPLIAFLYPEASKTGLGLGFRCQ
jgi:hypothetical protein